MNRIFRKIKDLLKKIFPPPTKSFMREITILKQENAELNRQLADVQRKLDKLTVINERLDRLNDLFESANRENVRLHSDARAERDKIAARFERFSTEMAARYERFSTDIQAFAESNKTVVDEGRKLLGEISKTSHDIYSVIPGKPVLWQNEFERRIVKANWGNVTVMPDFKEKYLRLISGLDPDSIEKVTQIIFRQKRFLDSDSKTTDFYTREEQEQLRLLSENFYQEIFRISEDVYVYKNYLLPKKAFEASVFYYRHGLDEVKTLNQIKGKAIVDVGGYIGDSILIFEELGPSVIYSFEANPENYALMQKTLEINHITNAIPVQIALGDHVGSGRIYMEGSCSGTVIREGIQYSDEAEIQMTTLDLFVQDHPMNIGLIKVDIEGAEPLFLEGAKKTICEQKPVLLISIYHNAHDFFELKPLIESWNLGYSFHIHKPTNGSATGETLLIAEVLE